MVMVMVMEMIILFTISEKIKYYSQITEGYLYDFHRNENAASIS